MHVYTCVIGSAKTVLTGTKTEAHLLTIFDIYVHKQIIERVRTANNLLPCFYSGCFLRPIRCT